MSIEYVTSIKITMSDNEENLLRRIISQMGKEQGMWFMFYTKKMTELKEIKEFIETNFPIECQEYERKQLSNFCINKSTNKLFDIKDTLYNSHITDVEKVHKCIDILNR